MAVGKNRHELTAPQVALVNALFAYPTLEKAARAVGVPQRTAERWVYDDPRFKDAYDDLAQHMQAHAGKMLLATTLEAVAALREVVTNPDTAPSVRVRAALGVCELSLKTRELDTLEERLDAIERLVADKEAA